jgi:Ala-tRNA(Pro) deacylase
MAIAPTLQRHLDQNVTYDVIAHEPTMSSARTAQTCPISGDLLAKGIVLRHDSGYLLAVIPATHHIRFTELRMRLGDNVELANEDEIARLFKDCARGAVPAQSAIATRSTSSSTTASRSSRRSIWRAAITRRSSAWARRSSRG